MANATRKLFDGEDVAEVLSGTYYAPKRLSSARLAKAETEARPAHYKVICISMYNEDLTHLDGMVDELKRRGFTKANRSALIRFALEQADLDKVKKGL